MFNAIHVVYKTVILILWQLLISSSDSEDENDIDLNIGAENLVAVVEDGLSKLKVEDSHGKQDS